MFNFFSKQPSSSNKVIEVELLEKGQDLAVLKAEAIQFPPSLVHQKIQSICSNTNHIIQEKAKKNLPDTTLSWHKRYVAFQKEQFAAKDKVNLDSEMINNSYDKTVKNWIKYIYKLSSQVNETLEAYSLRVAES